MNITKRVAVIGFLCLGTSALSFGDIFQSLDSQDWDSTYNASTALFGATVQQGGINLQPGFPNGAITAAQAFAASATESFVLTYDPVHGNAGFTLETADGPVSVSALALTQAPAGGTLDHIGIELGTASGDESVTISNLILNYGTADSGSLSSGPASGFFDFAMTPPANLASALMTLSGDITMNWSGDAPGAAISAEIVGADSVTVNPTPEPGTWALLGSSLLGLSLLRRKRSA